MRKTMPAGIATAFALCFWTFSASAAPATMSAVPSPAPFTYWVQYRSYDGRYPACPYRYHWACWSDPYDRESCGCHPEPGLYTGW
jgi:hypothetical protein